MTVLRALCIPGVTNAPKSYAWSPLHSDYTGPNFDIRVAVALDDWSPGAYQPIIQRDGLPSGGNRAFLLGVVHAGGTPTIGGPPDIVPPALRMDISADGTQFAGQVGFFGSPAPVPGTDREMLGLRFFYRSTPIRIGVGYKAVAYATVLADLENDAAWNMQRVFESAVSNFVVFPGSSAGGLSIGYSPVGVGSEAGVTGRVFAVIVKDGENGTTVACPDFTIQEPLTREFVDACGKGWFLNGSAEICWEGEPLPGGFLRQRQLRSRQHGVRSTRRNSYW